jgi:hypothetical protein
MTEFDEEERQILEAYESGKLKRSDESENIHQRHATYASQFSRVPQVAAENRLMEKPRQAL